MATVAAGHGKIEDALTIHVNSAGVPVSVEYGVRDDATCMGKRQMGYFQGIIPFETNVTIVAPSPSVKFVSSKSTLSLLACFHAGRGKTLSCFSPHTNTESHLRSSTRSC